MKKTLLLFLAAMLAMSALQAHDFAVAYQGHNLFFKITSQQNHEVAVTYYGESSWSSRNWYTGNIVIPPMVQNGNTPYSVTSIDTAAFIGCSVTSVSIPSSVTSISLVAFSGCENLVSVTINGTGLVTIGERAFYGCSSLTAISLPHSVTTLEDGVFWMCTNLSSLTLSNSLTTIGSSCFSCCNGLQTVVIPNTVTSLGFGAFGNCENLTSVTLGSSVQSLGNAAFGGCYQLSSINFPESLQMMGAGAFRDCYQLTEVNLGQNVCFINSNVFERCRNLTAIHVASSNPYFSSIDGVLYDATQTQLIKFPEGKGGDFVMPQTVTVISENALNHSPRMSSLVISDAVTELPMYLCYNDSSLTSVVMGNAIREVNYSAFDNCVSLETLQLPNALSTLGNCLYSCVSLAELNIPAATTYIGESFSTCTSLAAINVDENNEHYGSVDGVLYDKNEGQLSTLTVCPKSKRGEVVVPSSVRMCAELFTNCRYITAINFRNVVNFSFSPISGCESLTRLEIWATNLNYVSGFDIRADVASHCDLYVPYGCVDAYQNYSNWNRFRSYHDIVDTLTDGQPYTKQETHTHWAVAYQRSIEHTNWQALFVPFSAPYSAWAEHGQVARLYQVSTDGEGDVLDWALLSEGDTVFAGVPYIFKPSSNLDGVALQFDHVDILPCTDTSWIDNSTATASYSLRGTYQRIDHVEELGEAVYALQDGTFKRAMAHDKAGLNPFRIYLVVEAASPQSLPSRIHNRVDGSPVAIDEADWQPEMPVDNNFYDLLGRRVSQPQKGHIYIHNHKKIIY